MKKIKPNFTANVVCKLGWKNENNLYGVKLTP